MTNYNVTEETIKKPIDSIKAFWLGVLVALLCVILAHLTVNKIVFDVWW